MRLIALDTPSDMEWLQSVHGIPASFAILHGDEDAPEHVEAYSVPSPTIHDKPLHWYPDDDGIMRTDGIPRPATF